MSAEDTIRSESGQALIARWRAVGVDIAAVTMQANGTVATAMLRATATAPVARGQDAASLGAAKLSTSVAGDLELGEELGRGGNGVVRTATQRSLGRQVAVKSPLPLAEGGSYGDELVREARILGALQHPNIPPVHGLGRSSDGLPLLVMKRIEGVSWSDRLRETAVAMCGRAIDRDDLELAEGLLGGKLGSAAPQMEARVDALRLRLVARRESVHLLEEEAWARNFRVGAKTRAKVGAGVALLFGVSHVAARAGEVCGGDARRRVGWSGVAVHDTLRSSRHHGWPVRRRR